MTILVCGEALYDFFQSSQADQGEIEFRARVGGSPFNVAVGIARQGGDAALLSGISQDLLGRTLMARLVGEGVRTGYIQRSARRTTLSLVGLDEHGSPDYAFYGTGSADTSLTPEDMPDPLPAEIDALHFGSYSIAVDPAAEAFASLADRNRDRFLSLDPNVRPTIEPDMAVWRDRVDRLRRHADLIKVSAEDLGMLYPDDAPLAIARAWQAEGTDLVVVTDGAKGAVAIARGQEVEVPAHAIRIVDTVGAGDAFQATLLRILQERGAFGHGPGWVADLEPGSLLADAVRAAGIVCSRQGADMPTRAEI